MKPGAAATARTWIISERARNIHKITVDLPRVGAEFWCLLQSDVHFDNPHCDRAMLTRHLEQARERDAPILDAGDWFCAMQGKWDQRSNKSDLRPEHQTARYLDALVDTAAAFLQPYQDLVTVRGLGNHETAILKRHETHLTERLVERLKASGSATVALGGYSGYVVFEVSAQGRRYPVKLHYHHGAGGGGPVTRGVIQSNRQAVYIADADIIWNGHTHDSWQLPIARVRLNQDNTRVEHGRQLHIRTAGYKEEYGDGFSGYHVENWRPPKPTGAAWLKISYPRTEQTTGATRSIVEFDVLEAR